MENMYNMNPLPNPEPFIINLDTNLQNKVTDSGRKLKSNEFWNKNQGSFNNLTKLKTNKTPNKKKLSKKQKLWPNS